MKYITILDFEDGSIHIFPYLNSMGEDFSNISDCILDKYDIKFSENNCQWIITKGLPLQIH